MPSTKGEGTSQLSRYLARIEDATAAPATHHTRRSTSALEMLYLIGLLLLGSVLAEDPCPRSNIHNFYRELNCEPIYENAARCPSSFNCQRPVQVRNKSQCNFRGRAYEIGEVIPPSESDPCLVNCVCIKVGEEASFSCAVVDCPENWMPPPEHCVSLFEADKCCSVGMYCANDTSEKRYTCEYDGKTYYEGQRFYPEGDSCKRCYCKEGFQGKLEPPFCYDISCNLELGRENELNENCAPVYYGKQGCCPISWKCPSPVVSSRITPSSGNDTMTTAAKCKFGNLELRQFDVLEEEGIKCECVVPPHLTCFGG